MAAIVFKKMGFTGKQLLDPRALSAFYLLTLWRDSAILENNGCSFHPD